MEFELFQATNMAMGQTLWILSSCVISTIIWGLFDKYINYSLLAMKDFFLSCVEFIILTRTECMPM